MYVILNFITDNESCIEQMLGHSYQTRMPCNEIDKITSQSINLISKASISLLYLNPYAKFHVHAIGHIIDSISEPKVDFD